MSGLHSRSKLLFGASRKARIISVSALLLAMCAFGAAGFAPLPPDVSDIKSTLLSRELPLPDLASQVAALTQQQKQEQSFVREEKIRPGDTLAVLLMRLGVNDNAAADFIKADPVARGFLKLRPGKRVQAVTAADGTLQSLSNTTANGQDAKLLLVQRSGASFTSSESAAALEKRVEMRSGEIHSSLFAATDLAQVPDSVAMQMVDMYATDIDFASDLRRGDRFHVVYETYWQNGAFVRAGRILASEFVNAGKTYQAVWFEEPGSKLGGGYYGFDGRSMKKAFLKSPLEFTRISSGFSMRMHPILGQWKQHKGVDFAAPTGTPIRASGDGAIEFLGQQNGYGNVIVIKHWANYSTAYAHMSRFASGMRKGTKVSQGEVIGYVGATGWATGPHLHYEFRVNNQPRDPLSVDVPNAQPLAGADLQRFRSVTADMMHRFVLLRADSGIKLAAR